MSTRLLLVDDHAVVRSGLRMLLEGQRGVEIVGEAATAAEAFEKTAQLNPDVILMDIGLPDKSGIEATREIKKKISSLFGKARRFGLEKISSREITNDLDKNRENRSLLLRQLLYPLLPDGSLDEAVKAAESLGELSDVSRMAEQEVEERVNVIFDVNVPVKLSEEKSEPVAKEDVEKVLKYLQPKSVVG